MKTICLPPTPTAVAQPPQKNKIHFKKSEKGKNWL